MDSSTQRDNLKIQMTRLRANSNSCFRPDEQPAANGLVWLKPGNADWRLALEVVYLSDGFIDYVALSEVAIPGIGNQHRPHDIVRDE